MNPVATFAHLTRFDARADAANLAVAVVGMGYVGLPTAIAPQRKAANPGRHTNARFAKAHGATSHGRRSKQRR